MMRVITRVFALIVIQVISNHSRRLDVCVVALMTGHRLILIIHGISNNPVLISAQGITGDRHWENSNQDHPPQRKSLFWDIPMRGGFINY